MKVFSFKQFLEEEDSKAIVQTGINSKGLDNSVTKEILNSRLLAATNHAYLTPYIALGNVARILAYSGIVVPQYVFLDREEGEVVFDAPQFGQVAGVNIDGSPAIPKTQYYIYFSYAINEDGYYDCFAVLVDIDELDDIMDEGEEIEDEPDEVHNSQKLGEEVDLSEEMHPRQKIRTGSFVKISLLKRRDPNKHEIVGFKPGSDSSGNLDSYTVRAHLREPYSRTVFTPASSTRDVAASTIHKLNSSMHEEKVNEEQIDEISTALKNRYVKAATRDRDMATRLARYSAGEAEELKDKDPKRSKDFGSEVGLYKSVAAKRQAGIDLAKKKVNESKMKWREDTAHSEPHPKQDTIQGHKEAIEFWTAQKRHAKTDDERRRAMRKMADHQGQIHSMERQGVKEEVESIDERKSSDPKGLAYKVTAASHAAHPEWGPADHTKDPKTHFGTAATRSSTLAAVRAIRGNRNFDANNPSHVDAAAKAVHGSPEDHGGKPKGWSQTAMTHSGQTPEQKERRAKLTGPYSGLSDDEKEKDREIVRTVASNIKKK